jgi:hypothetical protein
MDQHLTKILLEEASQKRVGDIEDQEKCEEEVIKEEDHRTLLESTLRLSPVQEPESLTSA